MFTDTHKFCISLHRMNDLFRFNSRMLRDWLWERRERTHQWLAKRLGVSRTTVDNMLYQGRVPRLRTLARLAKEMGVKDYNDLLIPKQRAA